MKKPVIIAVLILAGFVFSSVVNLLTYPFLEIPFLVQYLIYPMIHSAIIILGYERITKKPIVESYKWLTFAVIYLFLVVSYFALDISPFPFYVPIISRYRG